METANEEGIDRATSFADLAHQIADALTELFRRFVMLDHTLQINAPVRDAAIITATALQYLTFDIETGSTVKLPEVGHDKYAAHPTTRVFFVTYSLDGGEPQVWFWGDPIPPVFFELATNKNWRGVTHNAAFDNEILEHKLTPVGWPPIPIDRFACTLARALAVGLPAGLDDLAKALDLTNQKDAAGKRLMQKISKPRKPRKGEDPKGVYWHYDEDPEKRARFVDYGIKDNKCVNEAHTRLPLLSPREHAVWVLDYRINRRGAHVDRQLVEAARRICLAANPELNAEITDLTDGVITSTSQTARLLQWLQAQGLLLRKVDRDALQRQLENVDLAPKVRRVIELRLDGAQAATKKIDALLARMGTDSRVRGSYQFHGAGTGRWSARGPQLQNLKKPTVKDIDAAVNAVRTGDYAHVKALYPRVLSVVGDCSRSYFTATPGDRLFGGDFSSIESRILASPLVANEKWKTAAYARYDATRDPRDEPYCATACLIYRVPSGSFTKDSPERSVGKTCDLAFGYAGGIAAWRKFEPDKFDDSAVEHFKDKWRANHPATVQFWRDVNGASVLATRRRGDTIRLGRLSLKADASFLQITLPSGRKLSYPQPRLIKDKYGRPCVLFSDNKEGQFRDCRNGLGAYGGLLTENIVQGIARDLLAEAMLRLEAANYPVVLHTHDEMVCEVPDGACDLKQFNHLMTTKPVWALELPIAASTWTATRYANK